MDKVITQEVTSKRRKKNILIALFVLALLSSLTGLIRGTFKSSLQQSGITTAVVETGSIENTITASGVMQPEFEQIITSPIEASIQNVLQDAGSTIKAGQSILLLDKSATQTEYDKVKFQLETKRNSIQKLRLELDKSFSDLQSNNDIKQLRINSLAASLEDAKRLYKAGGGTKEEIEKADLDLKVAQLEKKQLENEIKSKQQTMRLEMRESELAADIQENDLKELERKLQLANVVATRSGVVTWVNKNIGASIHQGESLARIADLSSFKVTGNISDNYLDQLHTGIPVIVLVNDQQFRGTISSINPSVQNGVITFDVQLDEHNNPLFRPNMKVDVYVVTAAKNNVLKVANGPAFRGASAQDIFVVQNGKAQRRTVHIGMSNFDFVEIKDGVKPGDVVITSDMSDYKNAKEVTIKN